MRIDIISIGNSKGVRIPSSVLKQCGLTDEVEMLVEDGKIILARPAARTGWAEEFARLTAEGEEELLLPEHSLAQFDREEWEW